MLARVDWARIRAIKTQLLAKRTGNAAKDALGGAAGAVAALFVAVPGLGIRDAYEEVRGEPESYYAKDILSAKDAEYYEAYCLIKGEHDWAVRALKSLRANYARRLRDKQLQADAHRAREARDAEKKRRAQEQEAVAPAAARAWEANERKREEERQEKLRRARRLFGGD